MYNYLIIGDGRVATHLGFYMKSQGLYCQQWSRREARELPALRELANEASRILLLISDSSIQRFLNENPFLANSKTIHCSGALALPQIESAHPLMTFGPNLYRIETYRSIPFITEARRRPFSELMPGLKNPSHAINAEKKGLYHALCSMSGNFTTILWEQAIAHFEEELKLPRSVLLPFMEQTFSNLKNSNESVLTGPLARGDTKTIVQHLDALSNRPEQNLYYAFLNYYLKQNNKIGELTYEHIRL